MLSRLSLLVPLRNGALVSTAPSIRSHTLRKLPPFCHARSFWSKRPTFEDVNPNAAQAQKLITALSDPEASHPDIATAAEFAKKAVEEGSPRGKTLLGSLYREGFAVPKDLDRAEQLFLEASEDGDPYAQCSLGALKLASLKAVKPDGIDPSSFNVAVAVDEQGKTMATQLEPKSDGQPYSQPELASDSNSEVVSAPTSKAKQGSESPAELVRKVRKERRKAGFSDSEAREFEQYKEEEESKRHERVRAEAYEWLERAIDQNHEAAMLLLAQELASENASRAVELFERAAREFRNVDAYFALGQIYERGMGSVERDLRASFQNFSMGAQLGDASAQLYMGHLYRSGSFVLDVDWKLATQYVEMSVKQKHPPALHYYGLMLRNGECGLQEDKDAFRNHIQEAADLGHGPSLNLLADMYYQGSDGFKIDHDKAFSYFIEAGKRGEVESLCSAAAMLFHGTGVEKDHHRAFELYQEAAVKGSVNALRNISSMYFYGHGVPVNKKLSEHFMNVADDAELNRKKSETSVNQLADVMEEPAPEPKGLGLKPRSLPPREPKETTQP